MSERKDDFVKEVAVGTATAVLGALIISVLIPAVLPAAPAGFIATKLR